MGAFYHSVELLESENRMGRFDDLTQESHQGDESRTSAISNRRWTRLSRGLSIAAAIWNVGNISHRCPIVLPASLWCCLENEECQSGLAMLKA